MISYVKEDINVILQNEDMYLGKLYNYWLYLFLLDPCMFHPGTENVNKV